MPLYEYACTACEHEFEVLQRFSDPLVRKCPHCGKIKVTKKVSLAGFQLKGAGWYKDGYAKASAKTEATPCDKCDRKDAQADSCSGKTAATGAESKEPKKDAPKKKAA